MAKFRTIVRLLGCKPVLRGFSGGRKPVQRMQLLEYCLDEWIPAAAEEELLGDVRYIIELYMREWLWQSQIELAEY